MQKAGLLILLVISMFSVQVQGQTQISNSNFEDWTLMPSGRDSLIGWSSSNDVVIYPVVSLMKDTSAYQGNFAGKVITAPFGFVQYSTVGVLVNGSATFTYGGGGGGANTDYGSGGGTPISIKPTALTGFYKSEPSAGANQGLARIILSKYNPVTMQKDTVSYATYNFGFSATYTPFTIPLPDLLPGVIPDTITTIFYSSNPATVFPNNVWNELYLDSIALVSSSVGIAEPVTESYFNVFPNPSNGVFRIATQSGEFGQLEIINERGQVVRRINAAGIRGELTLDLTDMPEGIYILKNAGRFDEFVTLMIRR
jgi:hypothetical protein